MIGPSLEHGNPRSLANFFARDTFNTSTVSDSVECNVPVCTSPKDLYTLARGALYDACDVVAYPVRLEVPYCALFVWSRFPLTSLGERVYCPRRSAPMVDFPHPDGPTIRFARRYVVAR